MDWTWANMDQVVGWVRGSGSWRLNVRDVAVGVDGGGEINRRVVDVLIAPDGTTYAAETSRPPIKVTGSDGNALFVKLAADSFVDLVEEGDAARALLERVKGQLKGADLAEVDALLQQPTVRSKWDARNSGGW